MHTVIMKANFIPLVFLFLLTSCDYEKDQIITGKFYVDDLPVEGMKLSLASGDDFEQCGKSKLSDETNEEGVFELRRKVKYSKIYTIVQHDSLCIYNWDRWQVVWKKIYGPAPDSMNFSCIKIGHGWHCSLDSR